MCVSRVGIRGGVHYSDTELLVITAHISMINLGNRV